ncbi:uncharacterized protein LOC143563706 isoform X2 [Bidens hawaiensis]|uniref:uncharacterized protein LOC143534309 isoform X2 n=1 Tax=Bidens hawaiensis TaxID=980011 RepID=UPI00404B42E7
MVGQVVIYPLLILILFLLKQTSMGQDLSRLEMFRAFFCKHGTTKNEEAANAIVEDEVFLKSILNPTEPVARGWVKSLDPNELVGGTEIGPKWCEVNVQVPIKIDEKMVRPYGLFSTIQDCIGASIAWPYPFISVVRED